MVSTGKKLVFVESHRSQNRGLTTIPVISCCAWLVSPDQAKDGGPPQTALAGQLDEILLHNQRQPTQKAETSILHMYVQP